MNLEKARFNMVEQQIRPWMVLDPQVLHVLSTLAREQFTPSAYRSLAYNDMEIPLGHGQTMGPPRIDARLMHDLNLKGNEKVLEIGTGSGYLTALLAARAQEVLSLEVVEALAQTARANLAAAGVHNAQVRVADGHAGAAGDGPFDAIVLGGSVQEVPQVLLDQIKVGGRLMAIVGSEITMSAVRFERTGQDQWSSQSLWEAVLPPLQGFAQASRFQF
ncbi:MAG: protein-L-isoaspartate O-methyltransferase [Limnohabitans sp.]|nr:protein-L-isoaspartate O-methyltransferase [Limnohabitans sp.]